MSYSYNSILDQVQQIVVVLIKLCTEIFPINKESQDTREPVYELSEHRKIKGISMGKRNQYLATEHCSVIIWHLWLKVICSLPYSGFGLLTVFTAEDLPPSTKCEKHIVVF